MPDLPITFRVSPLPTDFEGTLQQFMEAMTERLSLESGDSLSLFVIGNTAPTSNMGPWLKGGTTWYVWSDTLGQYVPEIIEFQSLRYVASAVAPDQAKYTFWIELDGTGKAIAIKYYSGAAWKDVYEDKFAAYSTTIAMNAAIAAAIGAEKINYPVSAYMGGTQSMPIDTFYHKVEYNTIAYNPENVYDSANYIYKAYATGGYLVTAYVQVDNDTADAVNMGLNIRLGKNGGVAIPVGQGGNSVPSPNGARWFLSFSCMIPLNEGDELEVFVTGDDGTNTGLVNLSNGNWSIHLVRET